MKRIVSLVLALSMVLSMFTFSFAGTGLKDVKGTKYEAAVEALVELGVVDGYADGTYLPEKVVTRNELAKLLVVAYGLESAAEVSTGVTPFADINAVANHWAAGYINVSADYKFVNGYPDGSFKGDNTVTYAEAITMCLRVLGYANEIESKGTWPTNYIAKAQELGLMEGIEFKSYNDGAKRGDIALLIWNMLRTKMWTVTGETEGDGLQSNPNKLMLNVKFKDYTYDEEEVFKGWRYDAEEEKVYVELENGDELEYAKNDFYTLVPGTEVSVLRKKTKTENVLLSIVANEDNVLVDGTVADLEEKYTNYDNSGDTYAYLLLSANKKNADIEGKVEFDGADSEYVTKVEEKSNYTKVKTTKNSHSIYEEDEADVLVIFGEERLSLKDLKAGDVFTWIADDVVVLSRKTVDGAFESLTLEMDASEDYRAFIELDGDEYEGIEKTLTVAKVNEKDEEEFDDVDVTDLLVKDNDYIEEDAVLYFNFLDEVVRMEFGVVKTSEVDGDFFLVTTGSVWSVADEDGATWYIKLANEDGTESYKFEEGKEDVFGQAAAGKFFWVEFNEDDEIKSAKEISTIGANELEDFDMTSFSGEKMDKDTKYIGTNKITDSTKVFTVREIEDKDGEPSGKFELVVTEGPDKLEGIEKGILALKDETIRAAYAFVEGESTSEDKDFGIVEKIAFRNGIYYVTVNGETYEMSNSRENDLPNAGSIIAYTLDSKDRIKVAFEYEVKEITKSGRVTDVDDTIVTYKHEGTTYTIDLDLVPDTHEDYRAFKVEVRYDKDGNALFDSIEEIELDEIVVKKNFGIADTNSGAAIDALVVIEGIEWAD